MTVWPCDQVATDLLDTQRLVSRQFKKKIELNIHRVYTMLCEYEQAVESRFDFPDLIEHVLQLNEPYADMAQRAGYKELLEVVLKRRKRWDASRSRNNEDEPSAPFFDERDL